MKTFGEWRYSSTILNLTTRFKSASRPRRFIPGERPLLTIGYGGWVGPKAGLDAVERRRVSLHWRESNPDFSVALEARLEGCHGLIAP
jgi:hypothetical protein